MRRLAFILFFANAFMSWVAEPWRLKLSNEAEQVTLHMDLYEESIEVPTMEMFGPMNGYMAGKGIYGVWTITSFNIKSDKTATLRLSNDLGSETQSIKLTHQTDSTYLMELQDGVVMKRAVNKKLVKIPAKMELIVRP